MCAASRVTTWPTRTTRLGALEILTRPRRRTRSPGRDGRSVGAALLTVRLLIPHLRAAAPGLDVWEFADRVGRAAKSDGQAALDLPGGYQLWSCGGGGGEPPTFASSQ